MDWMRNLYEKVKPYWWIPVAVCVCWLMVSDILQFTNRNVDTGTVERLLESQREVSGHIDDLISGLSSVEGRLDGIGDTVSNLQRLQSELAETTERIESRSFAIGDSSTESGIVADRLYRVNRELAKRLEETETE